MNLSINQIMSLLCKRAGVNVAHDQHWVGRDLFDRRCLLCGEVVSDNKQHALKHIKEHNLLAFL